MKALGITGFILSILLFLISMGLHFMLVPAVAAMEAVNNESGGEYNAEWMVAHDNMMNMAYVVLLGGGLSLILCVIPFIKTKSKMSLIGALLSLVALVMGLIHGTHMFS